LDLLSLEFSQREPRHFITKVLNYNYVIPHDLNTEALKMLASLKQYFVEDDALVYFLSMIGKSLRGGNVKDCVLFYFLEKEAVGKHLF
jgi:hypothetical protein